MQAILDDLTMEDHFSIIDFNHNVRCWSEDLVQGSSIQIADAKRYVKNIKPSGGEASWECKIVWMRQLDEDIYFKKNYDLENCLC